MKIKITYFRINVLFAVLVAINLLNFALSKISWPTLPAFPALIDGHPALSLVLQIVLVGIGVAVYAALRTRPKREKAAMVAYAVTVGIALAALFEAADMLFGTIHRP